MGGMQPRPRTAGRRPARPSLTAALAGAAAGILAASMAVGHHSSPVSLAAAPQSGPLVVVAAPIASTPATASGTTVQAAAIHYSDTTPFDAKGWSAPPRSVILPQANLDSCDSQTVPHPRGFFPMGGSGSETVTSTDGTTYTTAPSLRHQPAYVVCENLLQSGDLAIQLDVSPTNVSVSHFGLTVGPSGLVVTTVQPGHGAEIIPVGRRIGGWPGGCGTISIPDGGTTHAVINDTLCFDASGKVTSIDIHERAVTVTGDVHTVTASLKPVY